MNPNPPSGNKISSEETDEVLASRASHGDERAFFQLFHRHRRYVLTLVVRTSGRRDDAEDLVQEAFYQMHRSLPGFSGRSSFRTWFHGIVVRVCHSHTRNRLALRRRGDADAERMQEEHFDTIPAEDGRDEAHQHALRDWIQGCLGKMSLLHRTPLVLHLLSELEITDIARLLGIPEGSVKSRLFHARKRMARCLEARSS